MSYLLILHEVNDFNSWKKAYDDHANIRKEAQIEEVYLLQSVDNPNEVTILFEAQDDEKAKNFINSANLKEVMQNAGVIGKPLMKFLKKA